MFFSLPTQRTSLRAVLRGDPTAFKVSKNKNLSKIMFFETHLWLSDSFSFIMIKKKQLPHFKSGEKKQNEKGETVNV